MTVEMSFTDWLAVNQLIAKYNDAADRHDPEAYASCWSRDSVAGPTGQPRTREQIMEGVIKTWKGRPDEERHRHFLTNLYILSSEARRVRARCGISMAVATAEGVRLQWHRAYEDEIVKEDDGEWRFRSRRQGPYDLVVTG